ncbi:PBP1A family penicillin-binding protein [Spirulina subsalsa CS-330]|uniref:transglycosylase domain-containing protein n=1 Tax=Spirulina subsalsa TaxID=54311 RepID=UPI00232BE03F|nr:PBP1A family penicillin-binding protein [Spirulina subsalsa]MDB9493548.1 PBP1A family penicillin-binding protein [Spirulina subsalsa CS-330]
MSKFIQKPEKKAVMPVPESSTPATAQPNVPRASKGAGGRSRRPLYKRVWIWVALVTATGIGGGSAYLYQRWQDLEATLPESVDEVMTYNREETLRVIAADDTVLQERGPISHEELDIEEIPDSLVQSFIASEDRRFLNHKGVDYQGILRATWANLRAGEVVEGGSTITQQLSRIVYLNQDQEVMRKLREMRIAQKIENAYSKEEILERYLNLVYLGSGAYGVADAAWVYFGKDVDELTVVETAMLAGIAPAPSAYSPLENPEAAQGQRDRVLNRLYDQGFIEEAEYEAAIASDLALNPQKPKRFNRQVPYFTDYVQEKLPEILSEEQLAAGGLTVETSIDLEWQIAAEAAVAEISERYGSSQDFQQAALVAIDPTTGEIKAMVGGKDYNSEENNGQFNRVTQAQRQPGSTFKPFVYATAIAAGFSPYKSYRDAPYVVDGYEPKNYDETYRGNISMLDALTRSVNIPAVRALIEVGWNPVIEMAKKMGITSKLEPTYSLALGVSEVTLLELTSAYGTFANEGKHVPVHGITRILDRNGEVIYEAERQSVQAIDAESTAIMTWMLETVVDYGTGTAANLPDRDVAGKTGTSDDYRDLWFVGYIPQLVAGAWLGNDNNSPTSGASTTAAALWHAFMKRIVDDIPEADFPPRPDKLGGREATIEVEPIKPKKSFYREPPKPEPPPSNRNRSTPARSSSPSSGSSSPQSSPAQNSNSEPASSPANNVRKRQTESKPSQPAPSRPPANTQSRPAPSRPPAPAPAPAPPPAAAPAPPPAATPAPAPAPAPPAPPVIEKPPKPAADAPAASE